MSLYIYVYVRTYIRIYTKRLDSVHKIQFHVYHKIISWCINYAVQITLRERKTNYLRISVIKDLIKNKSMRPLAIINEKEICSIVFSLLSYTIPWRLSITLHCNNILLTDNK